MKFRTVLIIGLAIRLAIAPFFAHPFDVYAWYFYGENLFSGKQSLLDFLVPYGYSFFLFVFPATAIFNFLSQFVTSFTISTSTLNPILVPTILPSNAVVPGLLFDLLIKLPLIASDALIAYFIHKIVLKHLGEEKLAVLASAIWFLNPFSIWISSGWGMFDTLPALFTIIALYLVLERRFDWAAVSIIIAGAIKYYAIVLLVPLLVIAWQTGRRKQFLRTLSFTAVSSAFFLLPTFFGAPSGMISVTIGASQNSIHYSGLSIWTAITLFFSDFNQTLVSSAILVALLIGIYVWIWMKRSKSNDFLFVVGAFSLPIISLLIFYRSVGENFFIWPLPFLSIIAVRDVFSKRLYWILSAVALVSSMTDSLLPYYMLPMSPWIGGWLVSILHLVAPYRVAPTGSVVQGISIGKVILALLGIAASILLFFIGSRLTQIVRNSNDAFEAKRVLTHEK
ncbi:MAG: hypothetical protein ACYCPP_07515 [Nitrososphaerales archaeon]